MEDKIIVYDPVLCTGCMKCMTTCSTYNFGATSFTKSRIHMIRHEGYIDKMDVEDDLIFQPIVCQQCDKPYCSSFCPAHAIQRNVKTGAMDINYNKCIGCRMCIDGCPFGNMRYNSKTKQPFKCQLCDGDPQCVRICPTEALKFLPKSQSNIIKINRLARKIIEQRPTAAEEKAVIGRGNVHS
jgi:anaerobic carbon-monoxide dehydrogenase iron sulfur subunit